MHLIDFTILACVATTRRTCAFPSRAFGAKPNRARKKRRRPPAKTSEERVAKLAKAPAKPPLFGEKREPPKRKALSSPDREGHHHLAKNKQEYFGNATGKANPHNGESNPTAPIDTQPIRNLVVSDNTPAWKAALPTATQLRLSGFGKPDKEHSATQ